MKINTKTLHASTRTIALPIILLGISSACGVGDRDANIELLDSARIVTLASGELVEVTEDSICPDTLDSLASDEVVRPNPRQDNLLVFTENTDGWELAGDVTCTCNEETGGCSPFSGGGETGCIMTSCSECSKSGSESLGFRKGTLDGAVDHLRDNGSGVSLVLKPAEQLSSYSCNPMSDRALETYENFLATVYGPDFQLSCEQIEQQHAIEGSPPLGYAWAVVQIDGYTGTTMLPRELLPFDYVAPDQALGVSCSCNSDGTCPEESRWPCGTACNAADCASCTMSL